MSHFMTTPHAPVGKVEKNADKFARFERETFDAATLFTVVNGRRLEARVRREFGDLQAAIDVAKTVPQACVYAISPAGRSIVLDEKLWPEWLERYLTNQNRRTGETK
jgi:hypothetical protein